MSILRKKSVKGYTHISNDLLNYEGLSLRAVGLACKLLSKPDGWVIKLDYLVRTSKEGRQAIRVALHELAEHGFLMRERVRDELGNIHTVTHIADYPAFIDIGTPEIRINGYQPPDKSDLPETSMSENPTYQEPDLPETDMSETRRSGNREVLVNTDLVITKEGNTNKTTTENQNGANAPARGKPSPLGDNSALVQANKLEEIPEALTNEVEDISPYADVPIEQLAQTMPPVFVQAKKEKERPETETTKHSTGTVAIREAYLSALKEWEGKASLINEGATWKAAKRIAEKGFTPEQVEYTVNHLKGKWWADKHLPLAKVGEQIGAVLAERDGNHRRYNPDAYSGASFRVREL